MCGKKITLTRGATAQNHKCRHCGSALIPQGVLDNKPDSNRSHGYPSLADQPSISLEKPELPNKIGRYEVRALLGAGAFGQVLLAFDPNLGREAALKVPHADYLSNAKLAERFIREAKAGATLLHPHIVPVYDAGQDGNFYYIVSAYIQGETLQESLKKGPWDFRRSAQVVRQLAEALAYAHKKRIVHRDVKPANILIDEQGDPRLTDFGLASLHDGKALTQLGTSMGTPAYMAPEQGKSSKAKDPAVDQYSLGVVLYELLCGEVPFTGPAGFVMSCHVNQQPTPPHQRNSKVPRELEAICLKALAKKPEDRYPNCQALADDLQRWLQASTIPVATPVRDLFAPAGGKKRGPSIIEPPVVLPAAIPAERPTVERKPPRWPDPLPSRCRRFRRNGAPTPFPDTGTNQVGASVHPPV
jgi:serine/threonine protein kinase